jgi:hypothetical protein
VDAASKEVVDALEMKLIERVELRGVALGGLHEQALFGALRRGFLSRTSGDHHGSGYSNWRKREKLRCRSFFDLAIATASSCAG